MFRDTLVDNLLDVARAIPNLNVMGDEQLNAAAAQIEETMKNIVPDNLRRKSEHYDSQKTEDCQAKDRDFC